MKRSFLMYGLVMGLVILVQQVVHYRTLVRDLQLEFFGGIIAVLFMGLGVFLGTRGLKGQPEASVDKQRGAAHQLSERELEVLALLCAGHSNQEIADKLFVSLNTVKTHLSNIYQKLHVTRRTQAVQKARELGIVN
ncbi:helix-turn-helix transcriptional regulator [Marinoscillum furvescens]|uniref:Regulatory LuxR family protein n=1 Tax=Marinoscillum furvescens DSM 4134 TaxID=1122208 RepID=A0A3D9L3C3_MARFU|nr:response regulator transcription factor [Marinoscillum furvescens]RED96581.1 regulatory LuxR family protein [Marinoscillum furvescens DSM 4134]